MQKIFCCVYIFITALTCYSQSAKPQADFPTGWIGNWKGELKWHRIITDSLGAVRLEDPKPIKMELRIQPADSTGTYTWHLIYGEESKDSRPYILKPTINSKNHWLLDELNGIVIDHYYVAGRLSCAFSVMNSTIINNSWREGDKLIMEFYALTTKPVSTTGKDTEDSPIVNTYGMKGFQRAELVR